MTNPRPEVYLLRVPAKTGIKKLWNVLTVKKDEVFFGGSEVKEI